MALLTLIDLDSRSSYEFQYFPDSIRSQRRVNWNPQDTTIGTKPLLYSGREPKTLNFPELWYDTSESGVSLNQGLEDLEKFCTSEEDGLGNSRGSAARLLVTWGDRRLRCVLQDMTVEEVFPFDPATGNPLRAKVALELLEVQDEDGIGSPI